MLGAGWRRAGPIILVVSVWGDRRSSCASRSTSPAGCTASWATRSACRGGSRGGRSPPPRALASFSSRAAYYAGFDRPHRPHRPRQEHSPDDRAQVRVTNARVRDLPDHRRDADLLGLGLARLWGPQDGQQWNRHVRLAAAHQEGQQHQAQARPGERDERGLARQRALELVRDINAGADPAADLKAARRPSASGSGRRRSSG